MRNARYGISQRHPDDGSDARRRRPKDGRAGRPNVSGLRQDVRQWGGPISAPDARSRRDLANGRTVGGAGQNRAVQMPDVRVPDGLKTGSRVAGSQDSRRQGEEEIAREPGWNPDGESRPNRRDSLFFLVERGALGRIRTCGLLLRRQSLYPLSYEGGTANRSIGPDWGSRPCNARYHYAGVRRGPGQGSGCRRRSRYPAAARSESGA